MLNKRLDPMEFAVFQYVQASRELDDIPGTLNLYRHEDISQVFDQGALFYRPIPGITLSRESHDILGRWCVFSRQPQHQALRVLLSRLLSDFLCGPRATVLDQLARQSVEAALERRHVEVHEHLSSDITQAVVAAFAGLDRGEAAKLHTSSELIDLAADPSIPRQQVDGAVSLFRETAWACGLMDQARCISKELALPIEEEVLACNIGMLLYGFFGPLPAALTNTLLVCLLDGRWRGRPAQYLSLWSEECMRLFSPTLAVDRVALSHLHLGGTAVRPGQAVRCHVAQAHHDARVFDRPHCFDPERPNAGRHLAFGAGSHGCIGARLFKLLCLALLRHLDGLSASLAPATAFTGWHAKINATRPVQLLAELLPR